MSTTADDEAVLTALVQGTPLEGTVRFEKVRRSLSELVAAATDAVRNNPGAAEAAVNVAENSVDVTTVDMSKVRWLPTGARLHWVPTLSRPAADIYGGQPGNGCTFGFSVLKLGTTTKGITTAGHCADNQTYIGTNLVFKQEWFGGQHDEQWHTTPGFTPRNKIRDQEDGHTRLITNRRGSADQVQGAIYCKYGRTTFFGCGALKTKEFIAIWVPNAVASFHILDWNGRDLASPGDSGGPIFNFGEARGTTSGETVNWDTLCACNNVYVAIDRVEGALGLRVLTQ